LGIAFVGLRQQKWRFNAADDGIAVRVVLVYLRERSEHDFTARHLLGMYRMRQIACAVLGKVLMTFLHKWTYSVMSKIALSPY
jgi:hypothetical protein